ncbi:MAG: IS30 family transposase [Candidatus Moranbacteria bacterium]|nr:IS30 family transposase [Candidatus Moranbacteria bacterium]
MKKGFKKIQKLERKETIPSIDNRPCIVEARERIGDWEDDFVVSRNSVSCIKSVNERRSGLVFFKKTKDKTALSGDEALFQKLSCIPKKYRKTLTRDNGSENKNYKEVERRLGMNVYFVLILIIFGREEVMRTAMNSFEDSFQRRQTLML